MAIVRPPGALALAALACLGLVRAAAAAETRPAATLPASGRMEKMEEEIRQLQKSLREKDRQIEQLFEYVRKLQAGGAPATQPGAAGETPAQQLRRTEQSVLKEMLDEIAAGKKKDGAILSHKAGGVEFRLMDLSAILNAAAGTSTTRDEHIETLQGGGHDPRRRGFTFQQLELSIGGTVDPYFEAEAHIVASEDGLEMEEAFATTKRLGGGAQIEAGYFLTEFGRINSTHPHSWDFLDQPVIATRMFGGEGMRGPGVRLGQLLPLPWFSELHAGVQDATGGFMNSFRGEPHEHGHEHEDEHDHDTTIGGRPVVDRRTRSLRDLVYLTRWVNGFDLSKTVSTQAGASALYGPNRTGSRGDTWIYGADWVVKWRPTTHRRGWPHVIWQSEVMARDFRADRYSHVHDDGSVETLSGDRLHDWGLYSQVLYGFLENWDVGARYEFATGSGSSLEDLAPVGRRGDTLRNDRQRYSLLLMYRPTEFTRLRLQYNYDQADHLDGGDDHSVWLGFEVLIGSHPAHGY